MKAVLLFEALVGAWLIVSTALLTFHRGGANEVGCGLLVILATLAVALTRIALFRWVAGFVAFWLLTWTLLADMNGPATISNTLAALALVATVALEGALVRPAPG